MNQKIIPIRVSNGIINSLAAGVVPRVGLEYMAVGRKNEIYAMTNIPSIGNMVSRQDTYYCFPSTTEAGLNSRIRQKSVCLHLPSPGFLPITNMLIIPVPVSYGSYIGFIWKILRHYSLMKFFIVNHICQSHILKKSAVNLKSCFTKRK